MKHTNTAIIRDINAALEPAPGSPAGFPVDLRKLHAALRTPESFSDWRFIWLGSFYLEGRDFCAGKNDGGIFATREIASHLALRNDGAAARVWRRHRARAGKSVAPLITHGFPLEEQDRIRRIVGGRNICYENGVMGVSLEGERMLCLQVLEEDQDESHRKAATSMFRWLDKNC